MPRLDNTILKSYLIKNHFEKLSEYLIEIIDDYEECIEIFQKFVAYYGFMYLPFFVLHFNFHECLGRVLKSSRNRSTFRSTFR